MIAAQTLRVCRGENRVPTFPDHALKNLSLAVENFWVAQRCGTLVGVAALLERFYKPRNLMQHTIGGRKPEADLAAAGRKIPLDGYNGIIGISSHDLAR